MRFEVIGTGSIGLLLAAKLLQAQYSVQLWSRTNETAALINDLGIELYELGSEEKIKLNCSCNAIGQLDPELENESIDETYAIVAVKQTHMDEAFLLQLKKLTELKRYRSIVAIQNGVGHIARLAETVACPIITAVTSEGAKRINRNQVVHSGSGITAVGEELGRDTGQIYQNILENAMQKAGFTVFVSKNIKEQIYRKLMVNSIINPLTALFNVTNGELPQSKQRLKLMKELFSETKSILQAEEHSLVDCTFDEVLNVCRATASNTSSMRADVLNGHMTEISSINGAVARIATRSNKQAPLNESMVHIIEALHPEQ